MFNVPHEGGTHSDHTVPYMCECNWNPHACMRQIDLSEDMVAGFGEGTLIIVDGCPNGAPAGYVLQSVYIGFRVYVRSDLAPEAVD